MEIEVSDREIGTGYMKTEKKARRDEVLQEIRRVFRRHGYAGATITKIVQETGLGRASLYHHFPNGKEQMLSAVLEAIEQIFQDEMIDPLTEDLDPGVRMKQASDYLRKHYEGGSIPCFMGILKLTHSDEVTNPIVERIFLKWIEALAKPLIDYGVDTKVAKERAEDAVVRIQGSLLLSRAIENTKPFEFVMQYLTRDFLTGSEPHSHLQVQHP